MQLLLNACSQCLTPAGLRWPCRYEVPPLAITQLPYDSLPQLLFSSCTTPAAQFARLKRALALYLAMHAPAAGTSMPCLESLACKRTSPAGPLVQRCTVLSVAESSSIYVGASAGSCRRAVGFKLPCHVAVLHACLHACSVGLIPSAVHR